MSNKQVITLVIILLVIIAGFFAYRSTKDEAGNPIGLQQCPDEMIINRMPGIEPQSSYYIKDGERREISEYDGSWVNANCQVPVQEVF